MTKQFNKLNKTFNVEVESEIVATETVPTAIEREKPPRLSQDDITKDYEYTRGNLYSCLLYTSPSPRDRTRSRMPSSA